MRLIPSFNGRDIFKVKIDYAIDYELNPVHYNSQSGTCADCGHLMKTVLLMDLEVCHKCCNMESCEIFIQWIQPFFFFAGDSIYAVHICTFSICIWNNLTK